MDLDIDWREWLEQAEVMTFRFAARAFFVLMLLSLTLASALVNPLLFALVLTLLVATMLRIMLPDEKFQAWAESYWTGEAGDRWRRRFERVGAWLRALPGRIRDAIPYLALALVATLGPAVVLLAVTPTPAAAATTQDQCQTVVTHDSFRTSDTKQDRLANGSTVRSTVDNTRVSINDTTGFYRLTGENPNGYCVHFIVEVGDKGMPPAELPGTVIANDKNISAEWDAIHEFESGETYTSVEFTLPAATTATFAPSEYQVVSIAWYSQSTERSKSAYENIKDGVLGSPTLQKKTYTIAPGEEGVRTVPLKNQRTGEEISSYKAMWRPSKDAGWRAVGTDTSAGVFKQEVANDSAVKFHFDDPDAEVKFYANPGVVEKADYQWQTYWGGVDILGDIDLSLPFQLHLGGFIAATTRRQT